MRHEEVIAAVDAPMIKITVIHSVSPVVVIRREHRAQTLLLWREGIDFIRGHHADDTEEVTALCAAYRLAGPGGPIAP